MKNLTTALRTGDLRPKERVLLLVQSRIAKDKTGKEILTEADKHALNEGWRPDNNDQVHEYNRYLDGANLMNSAEIDAQTTYLGATNNLLRAGRPIDMAVFNDDKGTLDFNKRLLKERLENEGDALELVLKNSGLELDYTIYRYAFESLSEDLKKDILALYPDAETATQYLDQEEAIADVFNGKDRMTKEAKERLADMIVASLHNKHADLFAKLGGANDLSDEYFFPGYYAELPALEILSKWAVYNNQMPKKADDLLRHIPEGKEYADDSEEVADLFDAIKKELTPKITGYAEMHHTSVGALLKQTLLQWLDEGLFTKDFTPIWNSDGTDTCNGVETKLPQKEVLKEWLKAKRKSEQTIRGLIDAGDLKVEERTEEIRRFAKREEGGLEKETLSFKRTMKLITGESLYALKGDFTFAQDFKKQADELEGLGGLILYLRSCSFVKEYAALLQFLEIFKRLSKIYEIDVTYGVKKFIADFKGDTEMLNGEIFMIGEKMKMAIYKEHNFTFLSEVIIEDMLINLEKIEPSRERLERHYERFEELFGSEFGSYEQEK